MKTLLKPALHALWQALVAGLVTWYASADLGQVHGVSDAKRLALSALTAVGASLLAAARHAAPLILAAVARGRVDQDELVKIAAALDGQPVTD